MISIIGVVVYRISVADCTISVAVYGADVVDCKTSQVVESDPTEVSEASDKPKRKI